jgi:hypothetical protein
MTRMIPTVQRIGIVATNPMMRIMIPRTITSLLLVE